MIISDIFRNVKPSGRFLQIFACITATIACFNDALLNVWPAPAIPKLQANDSLIHLDTNQESLFTSMALISLSIGAIFTIHATKIIGSKNIILLSSIPTIIAWLLVIFATTVTELYISRFIAGFTDAMCYVAVPGYVGDIAEPALRGVLSTIIMISFNFGVIITYYFGYVLPLTTYPVIVCPLPIIVSCIFYFMPQSPSYLILKGHTDEAQKQLKIIRDTETKKEFEEIKQTIENELKNSHGFLDLFRTKVNRKATIMLLLTVIIWQCSGIVVMTLYLHSIVLEAKINVSEVITTTLYAVVQFISGIGATFIVDRLGRKPLLYISCTGSATCLILLGTYFFMKDNNLYVESIALLPVISLVLYIIFASIGLGIIPVVYTSELFSYNMQIYGGAILSTSFGLTGLAANSIFQIIAEAWSLAISFWIFAILTYGGVIITYFFLPETKNKTRIEIQRMLSSNSEPEIQDTKC